MIDKTNLRIETVNEYCIVNGKNQVVKDGFYSEEEAAEWLEEVYGVKREPKAQLNLSEQVKELRTIANNLSIGHNMPISLAIEHFRKAADTIESLSAKLQAANMEHINLNEILKEIREKAQKLSNQHWGDDERHLVGKGIQCMCVQVENIINKHMERSADCGGWIPCKKRLPEKDTDVLIRYYNSKEGKFLTDIAWIDEEGDWQFIREKAGYFPPNFKKEITKWMPLPGE